MTYRNLLSLCILVLMCSSSIQAQIYVNKEWVYESGVADDLNWASSSFDADGNLIVVGNVSVAPGNSDVLVTKYDPEGTMLWQETFDGPANGFDYGVKAVCDAANNTYVAAAVMGSGSEHDITVLKYDENGGLVWTGSWNGTANLIDAPVSMLLDPNGHLYVGGITHATLTNIDYALVKFGTSGQVLWSNTYDHAGLMEIPTGIELDISMNPVITGGSASSTSNWDFATVIYNQITGAQMQVSRVATPGVGLDRAYGIAKDVNANLYVTGYTENLSNWDVQTVKLDASFNLEWATTWEGVGFKDAAKAIGTDGDGNVFVTGYTTNAEGGTEFITIKYDGAGNELWAQRFKPEDPTWQAVANKLVVDGENNCLVTGTMFNGNDMDFWTVVYNPDGELLWAERHDGGNGDDEGKDIITDGENIFITGLSNTGSGAEYTTIKYTRLYKEENILYDGNGDPVCVDGELIIKFNPDLVDPNMVDDRGQQFAPLYKFVPMSVVNDICGKIGFELVPDQLMAFKIHRRMTTADSVSTSRQGTDVALPEFWSTLLVTIEGMNDPFVVADSLTTMDGIVEYAEPNFVLTRNSLPNDPLLTQQENLVPMAPFTNANINMEGAWDIQKGQSYVRVGVFDDPILWAHEDFGDGTYAGSKVKGGWSWPQNVHISNITSPGHSHGTACAGIIGALSNNGVGIAGIAGGDIDSDGNSGIELVSLAIANGGTFTTTTTISSAIVEGSVSTLGFGYALDVQNHSWGTSQNSTTLYDAVKTCAKNGCVFVAARGNHGTDQLSYPACIRDAYVLNVGGSGTNGELMDFINGDAIESAYGGGMDIIAPGTIHIVPSTVDENTRFNYAGCNTTVTNYDCFRGTSAAAPHAAGVAALLMSEQNVAIGADVNLAPEDVEFLMQKYATDLGAPNYDPNTGWGRIDAANTLQNFDFPQHRVFHSGGPDLRITTVVGSSSLFNIPAGYGLAGGLYYAEKVEVTESYTDNFPSATQILDGWGRITATTGVTTNFPSASDDDGVYSFSFSGNQATVTGRTYTWHVTSTFLGQAVNAWIPYTPSQLRTAYSLHLYDATMTGIDEQEVDGLVSIYPSPAGQWLNVELTDQNSAIQNVTVFDAVGKLVLSELPSGQRVNRVSLKLAGLAKGTYVVQISTTEGRIAKRFVKGQ